MYSSDGICEYFGTKFDMFINPLVTNEFFHPYHLDESTFNFRGSGVYSFLFHFSMKFK